MKISGIKRMMIIWMMALWYNPTYSAEIINFKLSDDETIKGKLDLPADHPDVPLLVIFVRVTGPNTYLNKRQFGDVSFNYYDLFVRELYQRGIGFFSYNRRGVTIGDQPPYFDRIDSAKYAKYTPQQEALDVESIIATLKQDPRFAQVKIVLLGASEGTVVASMVADRGVEKIDALLLMGYANDNIRDIIQWQLSGKTSIINLRKYFDKNKDNVFSREEYESTDSLATWATTNLLRNATFESLDLEKDSVIDYKDFSHKTVPYYDHLMKMVDEGNDTWIWNNYFRVTSNWMKAHFGLEANQSRLLRIDIPIYIFHGINDANAPVEGVYDIEERFRKANKRNLQCYTFEGHDHDLNYVAWPYKHEVSEGLKKVFYTSESLLNQALGKNQ